MEKKEIVIDSSLQLNLNLLKVKPYNTVRIKSRNFLSNISYNRLKEECLFDRNFIFDILSLITKNINPFSLKRKIYDAKNKEMMNMFWEECNGQSFCKHICKLENSLYLNGKNVIYPHVDEIVWR